jgi:hypothetical protein
MSLTDYVIEAWQRQQMCVVRRSLGIDVAGLSTAGPTAACPPRSQGRENDLD